VKPLFDHEKLTVHQESIAFCASVGEFLPAIRPKTAAQDQLDRAPTSIPLNVLREDEAEFRIEQESI
jgi:hypothetical protein